ncbi:hypothetical protein [Bradyrhizobium sp. AS23.2]|uniref:hypothetical protein n=1 Tax=Bradyrhizobium sp. AS23.2 TaxID=1680155 RepID=UPI001160FACC|nr:hypothetical protein [Bradyrhizobium sp. AS23.2]
MPATIGRRTITWPVTARAQQPMPVIGVRSFSVGKARILMMHFVKVLMEVRHLENQNVIIEWRWAEGYYDRLPEAEAT